MNKTILSILSLLFCAISLSAQVTTTTTVTETTINGTDTVVVTRTTTVTTQSVPSSVSSSQDPNLQGAVDAFVNNNKQLMGDAVIMMAQAADSLAHIGQDALNLGKTLAQKYADRIAQSVVGSDVNNTKNKAVDEAKVQVDNIFAIIEEATRLAKQKADSVLTKARK